MGTSPKPHHMGYEAEGSYNVQHQPPVLLYTSHCTTMLLSWKYCEQNY